MSGEFKARALDLYRAGHRVVPIPKGLKGVLIKGWTELADSQDEDSLGELIKKANGCGVGILSKWTAGVDIDVRDGELAQKLAGLAHTILGSTVERIGEAPKLLLPYRVETPFAKISSHSFRLPADRPADKPHRVEILGDGQQWVAYHIHPATKRPYRWPDGDLPAREDLPELDEAKARLFIERAEAAIFAAGGRIETPKIGGGGAKAKANPHGQAGTYDAIADAMRHIPNPSLAYDNWVAIALALKGALGELGRELWEGWSELSEKNDPETTAKVWGHAKPTAIGAGTIYHLARQAGWKPDRKLKLNPEKAKARTPEEPPPHPGEAEHLVLDPSDPLPSAVRYVGMHHTHQLGRTLHRHGGSFYAYAGTHFRELPAEALRATLYPFLAAAKRQVRNAKTGELDLAPFKPTTSKVSQVVDALVAHTFLSDGYAMPAWLDDRTGLPPRELVPLSNGMLHLPTGQLVAHTPRYFGGYALPFAYDPAASEPAEWLRFLGSIWPDDSEARDTLQELMGLLLTPETRYQKLFLIVGPKRSGKGTVGRVIRAMLGACNVAGPTLSGLATNFGLQPLIGKPAAIISDARLSGRADATVIAERLLSISGEDAITVDRKHVEPWTGTLPIRFVILTNELPRIADASGALASRFVVLTMRESFFGREDNGLTDRLIAELPGILNWAVAGWKRLAERGHFVMPASSAEALEDIESLSSPMLAFLRARCVVRPGVEVPCDEIFEEWCGWCKSEGRDHTGTSQSFGRDLKAAVSGIKVRQPRWEGQQRRVYVGVGLRSVSDNGPLTRDDTRDSHCSALFIADGDEGTKRSQWGVGNSEEKSARSGVTRVSSRVIADVDDEEIVL